MFFGTTSDDLQISSPSADRFLFNSSGGNTTGEFNFNVARFSMGAQTGLVGNQVGVFVAGATTVTVPGGFSQFLLTQAGNLDLNGNAMSQVFGWTINAPSIVASGGSSTDSGALLVGGNVTVGTNRYGVLITSNPSGGTLNYALAVSTGDTLLGGDLDHTGTNVGLYGAPPVAQAADPVALTDSTGGTANNTVAAVSGTGDDATINDNFADLTAKYNALRDMLSETAGGIGIAA